MSSVYANHVEASLLSDISRLLSRLGAIRQGRIDRVDANSHQLGRAVESLTEAKTHLTGCLIPSED